jgi:uncharacterized membrane protein
MECLEFHINFIGDAWMCIVFEYYFKIYYFQPFIFVKPFNMYTPTKIVFIHLIIILPCILIGTYLIFAKKGSKIHKLAGKTYMALMAFTSVLTLFIPAQVGQKILNHFGVLHLLSLLTLLTVPKAWFAIKRGDVKTHKSAMIKMYVGGIIIAGCFAVFVKGRYLHYVFFD